MLEVLAVIIISLIILNILGAILFKIINRKIVKLTNIDMMSLKIKIMIEGVLVIEVLYLFALMNINPEVGIANIYYGYSYPIAGVVKSTYFLITILWSLNDVIKELKGIKSLKRVTEC